MIKNILFENPDNPGRIKYSTIFLEFLKPTIRRLEPNSDKAGLWIKMCIATWNKAVAEDYPDHFLSRDFEYIYEILYLQSKYKNSLRKLYYKKRTAFDNYNFFIAEVITDVVSPTRVDYEVIVTLPI